MPYKIFTYADPYRIYETDFWNDIKGYPQLCASRTLVNGLLNVMGNHIESLLCPIDDIVGKRVFSAWSENISRRIQQYSEIGRIYSRWHKAAKKPLSDQYYEALVHNKDSMLDAVRLFIELGIDADSLDTGRLNYEHRLFVYLLKLIEGSRLFSLPKLPARADLIAHFAKQAEHELCEKKRFHEGKPDTKRYRKEIQIIKRMIESMEHWDGQHVVIHGIHQFTPLQLKLITHMDSLGMEVIFMYNYLPEYKEIYSSWEYIYQQFDAPIHHDENIKGYGAGKAFPKKGMAIADSLAMLCEENVPGGNVRIRRNYEHYKDERVLAFDNVSEYAGYVSDLFAAAEYKLQEEIPLRDRTVLENPISMSAVLARMDDVIYTANKDVDDLLQVYHPEYARNRHFLAYPIGQFFVAMYGLWNASNREIDIDYGLLRECVNSGIMTEFNSWQLLKTLMNLEPMFARISTFTEFKTRFQHYMDCYKQVDNSAKGSIPFSLGALNIYSSYKVPLKEIEDLYNAVCEINDSALILFGDVEADEQFQFATHFDRLKDFVSKKRSFLVSMEEKDLISKLLTRLDIITGELKDQARKGTLDDLRAGLYFFLKQKEEPVPDWFVKNFEQIDGDVLNSMEQDRPGRHRVYHFACVSDRDMSCKIDDLLPWPLSDFFIEKAFNPRDLSFQVYYSALQERGNFMRYALFYGLYFSRCETKISFVRHYEEESTDCYGMLRLIGLESKDEGTVGTDDNDLFSAVAPGKPVNRMAYVEEQMAAMMFCPYRYLLDYVLNPRPYFSGSFLIQRYFVNVLIDNTWKSIQNKNAAMVKGNLSRFVNQEAAKLKGFFPFFMDTEIIDLKKQAENYITASSKLFNGNHNYNPNHMELRKIFGMAKFYDEMQDLPMKHTYETFENLAEYENGKKAYSAHSIRAQGKDRFVKCALEYINSSEVNRARTGSWCVYCANKNICFASYVQARG